MMQATLLSRYSHYLYRLWSLEKFGYSLRVSIALSAAMWLCWLADRPDLVISPFLGIIASSLAETDDHWTGRLKALLVTLLCFAATAIWVKLLFRYPLLFALCMALSAFLLVMLGAIGERYATIAQATLILSIYSMIAMDQHSSSTPHYASLAFWRDTLLLLLGAAWYGLLSVLWSALFSHQPVQHSLARLYRELATYFRLKADLFEPYHRTDIEERRLALARQNARTVAALNSAKEMLLHRQGYSQAGGPLSHYYRLYFLAQDLHERITSSHYPYQALSETFFHSDVLFRCQRLLRLQSKACLGLASSLLMQQPFRYGAATSQAMSELRASLDYLQQQGSPAMRRLLRSLYALARNLENVQTKLTSAAEPADRPDERQDNRLRDLAPRSLREALGRIITQLDPSALLFRHALRMALALLCGYITLHAVHPQQGYWILLTTVFVCQPSYGATRIKLVKRISGTLLGLLGGWACFALFPDQAIQAAITVVAGVLFFIFRSTHYTLATAAITLMILFCFNQTGDGYALIWPRLLDTLMGCLIAVAAVFWVLPDWQGRRLNRVYAETLACSGAYLRQIMQQYDTGKQDDLPYRIARRNVHNAEAVLSRTLSNMLLEPEPFRQEAEAGFRFLSLSHTLLNYLSALGAHRASLPDDASDALLDEAAAQLADHLDGLARDLQENRPVASHDPEEARLVLQLEQLPDDLDEGHRLVQSQLLLICRQLESLRLLATQLQKSAAP